MSLPPNSPENALKPDPQLYHLAVALVRAHALHTAVHHEC